MFNVFMIRKSEVESTAIFPLPKVKLKPVFFFELSSSISLFELPEDAVSLKLLLSEVDLNQIPRPLLSLIVLDVMLEYLVDTNLIPPTSFSLMSLLCI